MITCPNCGKDNELGRIFCLKCGAKLDLNAIAPPTSAKNPALRKAKRAAAATVTNAVFKTIKLLFLSLSTAFITLIFLPPDMTRYKPTDEDGDAFEEKKFQLEDAVNNNKPFSATFSEVEINGMLKKYVKTLNDDFKSPVKVGSIYASLGEGTVTLSIDRKWKYFHIFLVYSIKPAVNDGKFVFEPAGGAIGRLPLPKFVLDMYTKLLTPLGERFKLDKQTLDQVTEVKVKPNFITLIR